MFGQTSPLGTDCFVVILTMVGFYFARRELTIQAAKRQAVVNNEGYPAKKVVEAEIVESELT